MKKKTSAMLALLLTASAGQSRAQGYFEFIPYYNNDPFLFCTLGVPQDCWIPVSAALGTFTVTNQYCFNPVSAAQFARVCPHAFQPGASASSSDAGAGGSVADMGSQQQISANTIKVRDPAMAGGERDPANASP